MRRFLKVMRHVLFPKLCRECRKIVEEAMLDLEDLRHEAQRLRPEMARQRTLAPVDCDSLLREPKEQRIRRVRRSYTRYGTRPMVEEHLRRSLATASADAEESHHLAVLAQEAVKKIIGRERLAGGERALPDLNALVRSHLGNACRILGRYDEAEEHFRDALVFLLQGTGDLVVLGDVYSLYGSYLRCRRQTSDALIFLGQAEDAFLSLREDRRRAKVLLKQAAVLEDMRELEDAVRLVRRALTLLDGESTQALRASAHHNLAFYLCELDRSQEALAAFEEGEELFRWLPVPVPGTVSHRRWTHGKVRWGLGELERAEDLLLEAHEGFARRRDPFRCALVSLDLAGVYAQQDRFEDLFAIVRQTYEGLRSQGLEPEAEKVLRLLVDSAQRRQLTLAVLHAAILQLRGYLSCRGASC